MRGQPKAREMNPKCAQEVLELILTLSDFQPKSVSNLKDGFQDSRLDTGYEAVPTRDIHLKQINLEETWLEMLKLYVKPLVEGMFMGYNSDVRGS